jgi:hypothetical protein
MMKRLGYLVRQDLVVAFRSRFPHAVLVVALIFISLILFVAPEQLESGPGEMHLDLTQEGKIEEFLRENGWTEDHLAMDRQALDAAVEAGERIGILWEGTLAEPEITIFHQGSESDAMLQVIGASLEGLATAARGESAAGGYLLEQLRPTAEPIPFNLGLVPLVIAFDVVLLGFMFIAVMIFQEKQEGSIRAFRVSPGRTVEYITAKTAVNIMLGILYTFLLVMLVTGIPKGLGMLLLVVVLTSLLMTLLGLLLSVFFANLSEFLFVAIAVSALFTLPMVSYFQPSFAPAYLRAIPSYPVLFGLREIFFPTGSSGLIWSVVGVLAAETLVLAGAAYWAVHSRLMKEGH